MHSGWNNFPPASDKRGPRFPCRGWYTVYQGRARVPLTQEVVVLARTAKRYVVTCTTRVMLGQPAPEYLEPGSRWLVPLLSITFVAPATQPEGSK